MYKAAAAGLTVGGGAQVARFQNANGVTSNWLEHSLAKQYPCFGWDDHCFALSDINRHIRSAHPPLSALPDRRVLGWAGAPNSSTSPGVHFSSSDDGGRQRPAGTRS